MSGEPAQSKLDTLRTVELPEGVEIQLRVAGPMVRAVAFIYDALFIGLIFIAAGILTSLSALAWGGAIAEGIYLILNFIIFWFYFVYFESGKRSATPGKRKLGLIVTTDTGGPISAQQALIRNFIRVIDFLPMGFLLGLVASLSNKNFQRLGDLAAGTVVCYAKPALARAAMSRESELKPIAPRVPLNRNEQEAMVSFSERQRMLSTQRRHELAGHLQGLTRLEDPEENYQRVMSIAAWVEESSEV